MRRVGGWGVEGWMGGVAHTKWSTVARGGGGSGGGGWDDGYSP